MISGTSAGIFIFTMCLTGALLSFESNVLEFAEREMRVVQIPAGDSSAAAAAPSSAQRLPISEIISKVQAAKPGAKPSGITLQNDKTSAAVVALGREGQVYINPYTGGITGEGAKGWRDFFRLIEDVHRYLALSGSGRVVGKSINDAANFLFLLLAITGIYIWFPRRLSWRHFRASMALRWKVTGRARDFNWHTVIGFWSSLVLIVLTATAVVMSYQWANNLLYSMTGSELPQQLQQTPQNAQSEPANLYPDNLEALWTRAENHTNWKFISLRLPITRDSAVFTIDEGKYWNKFGRSALTVDAKTAEVSKWESYGDQNAGRRLRSWVRFTHTGETGGFIGQLVGFLACLGGTFLVWTGLSLAWRRFRNWRSKESVLKNQ